MDETTRATLREAYQKLKAGDKTGACALIKPVLAANRENVDAWWLAVHAADTPEDTETALREVLRLKSDHAPARLMLDRFLVEHPPAPPPLKPVQRTRRGSSNRWVWIPLMIIGCLGMSFSSMALISGIAGSDFLDQAVENVSGAVGIDVETGKAGQFGTVQGGNPSDPRPIPITQVLNIESGDVQTGSLRRNEAHIWTFRAWGGQEVMVMLQFTVAGDASAVLELRSASGHKVASGVGEKDSGTVTLVHTLTETGEYELVIIGRPDGPRGDYGLGLELSK